MNIMNINIINETENYNELTDGNWLNNFLKGGDKDLISKSSVGYISNPKTLLFLDKIDIKNYTSFESSQKINNMNELELLVNNNIPVKINKTSLMIMLNTEAYVAIEGGDKLKLVDFKPTQLPTQLKPQVSSSTILPAITQQQTNTQLLQQLFNNFKQLSYETKGKFLELLLLEIVNKPDQYNILFRNLNGTTIINMIKLLNPKQIVVLNYNEVIKTLSPQEKPIFDKLFREFLILNPKSQAYLFEAIFNEIIQKPKYYEGILKNMNYGTMVKLYANIVQKQKLKGGSQFLASVYNESMVFKPIKKDSILTDLNIKNWLKQVPGKSINTLFIMTVQGDYYIIEEIKHF